MILLSKHDRTDQQEGPTYHDGNYANFYPAYHRSAGKRSLQRLMVERCRRMAAC
jgi:hypothetical protein